MNHHQNLWVWCHHRSKDYFGAPPPPYFTESSNQSQMVWSAFQNRLDDEMVRLQTLFLNLHRITLICNFKTRPEIYYFILDLYHRMASSRKQKNSGLPGGPKFSSLCAFIHKIRKNCGLAY